MNGSAPVGRGGLWRAIWRRFVARQHLIAFPAAIIAAQAVLLVPLAIGVGRMSSFSRYARAVYHVDDVVQDGLDRLGTFHPSIWIGLVVFIAGQAVVDAWLRPGFLRGLLGEPVTLRPERTVAVRIFLYSLIFDSAAVALGALAGPAPLLALLLFTVLTALFLYGDYAIVVDDVGVPESLRRSLRVARATLPVTLLVVVVAEFLVLPGLIAAFGGGFDDTRFVFPPYLLAFVLVQAVQQYAVDVALITVYAAVPTAVRRGAR